MGVENVRELARAQMSLFSALKAGAGGQSGGGGERRGSYRL